MFLHICIIKQCILQIAVQLPNTHHDSITAVISSLYKAGILACTEQSVGENKNKHSNMPGTLEAKELDQVSIHI